MMWGTKGLVVIAAMLLLTACSGETKTAALTQTQFQQLSQTDWVDMTSASTAVVGYNNSLIMMR